MPKQFYGMDAIRELERYLFSLEKLTPEEIQKAVSLAKQSQGVKNSMGVVTTLVSG